MLFVRSKPYIILPRCAVVVSIPCISPIKCIKLLDSKPITKKIEFHSSTCWFSFFSRCPQVFIVNWEQSGVHVNPFLFLLIYSIRHWSWCENSSTGSSSSGSHWPKRNQQMTWENVESRITEMQQTQHAPSHFVSYKINDTKWSERFCWLSCDF